VGDWETLVTQVLAPTIFESFNARSLRPAQVAETFVPSDHFRKLCRRRHTVIFGPRGSGKTTLLKMLQKPALDAWQHPDASSYRQAIEFTGVFIPTDVSWSAQISSLGEGRLDEDSRALLGRAAFTTHALRALAIAMAQQIGQSSGPQSGSAQFIELGHEAEANLVGAIIRTWHIKPQIPSLLSLKHALSARLSEIRLLASQAAAMDGARGAEWLRTTDFLHLSFLQAASVAVELFDDLARGQEAKWALLFDELELAPDWMRRELVQALRSTDERFLYKLALSPYSHDITLMDGPGAPSPGNDYEEITLWYAEKRDGYAFCEHLWESMLRTRGYPPTSPYEILGRSYFETPPDEWRGLGTAYGPGSRLAKRFISLAKSDLTFRAYLNDRRIEPSRLHRVRGEERAAEIRKIAPLVAVREWFRKHDLDPEGQSVGRSRKTLALYAGAESLFAITEGNPRWFIGIVGQLLERLDSADRRIQSSVQAEEIRKASQRFAALLRTIPVESSFLGNQRRGVLSLLKTVGDWFHRHIVELDFSPEPPGTFIVDSGIPEVLLRLVGQALNTGALVYVPDEAGHNILRSLRGKRFRLSYLLAAQYGLPLRLGRAIALGTILRQSGYLGGPGDQLQLDYLSPES
jgi:hypothetical protein